MADEKKVKVTFCSTIGLPVFDEEGYFLQDGDTIEVSEKEADWFLNTYPSSFNSGDGKKKENAPRTNKQKEQQFAVWEKKLKDKEVELEKLAGDLAKKQKMISEAETILDKREKEFEKKKKDLEDLKKTVKEKDKMDVGKGTETK